MERTAVEPEAPQAALHAPTVAEAFVRTARANADRVAIRTRGGEREITWGQYKDLVDGFALSLRKLGL